VALPLLALAQASGPTPGNAVAAPTPEVGLPVVEGHSNREFNAFGQVWTIVQDRRGLMYMGVSGGDLLEYDGVTWRKIPTTMDTVRSLATDEAGKIWLGGNGGFGYVEPDATGTMHYVSLLDKVPEKDRSFTDVWQTLVTPQGVFFRSYQLLFRWDGKSIHVWSPQSQGRFQALSSVQGHIYTAQNGVGLQEIVGDELRLVPGGEAYKDAIKLFLYPYDDGRMIVSQRDGLMSLYDGQKVTPFPTQADDYLKLHRLYTSALLKDGSLCLTTLNGGALIIGHDGKLRQLLDVEDGLLDSGALSAFEDRDGALWIGSGKGATRVEISSPVSIFSRSPAQDATRFEGSVYLAQGGGAAPVQKLISDPKTNRPIFVPLGGTTQAFVLAIFRDPLHKTPDQLLAATSDGVMRVQGEKLVPAMPGTRGPTEQCYSIAQSRVSPNRIFIAHGDGVGSMRWDGQKWIDEGKLPGIVTEARTLAEDTDGTLFVGGASNRVLRITIADSGMRDSKAEFIAQDQGLPKGVNNVASALGSVFVGVDRNPHPYRWDRSAVCRGRSLVDANRCVRCQSIRLPTGGRKHMGGDDVVGRSSHRQGIPAG
jgi:ligand-binding sensor domain-containing protein